MISNIFKNDYFLVLVLILVQACVKDLEVQPPYHGNKPVVNAYVCSQEGVLVHLSYSLNPVGQFLIEDSDNTIADALIILYENGQALFPLSYLEDGYYQPDDEQDFEPKPGYKYRLSVDSPLYGQVQSEEIVFPKPLGIKYISVENIGRAPNESYRRILMKIVLDWQPGQQRYVNLVLHSNEEEYLYFYWEDSEYRDNFMDPCEVENPFGMVLSNACGYSDKDTLRFITYKEYNKHPGSGFDRGLVEYTGMQWHIHSVGKEYFDYSVQTNYFLDDDVDIGLLFGINEPLLFKGNIQGGYGLFYARSIQMIDLPVH